MTHQEIYGNWWTTDPERKVPGTLIWEPPNAPVLEVLETFGRWDDTFSLDLAPIPIIKGEVARFAWITLLGARYGGLEIGGLSNTSRFHLQQAITRVHLDDPADPFVRRIEMDVPAVAALLGTRHVIPRHPITGRTRELRVPVKFPKYVWSNDGIEIQIGYQPSVSSSGLQTTVGTVPQVWLSSSDPRSLEYWWEEWIRPLSKLVRVGTAQGFVPTSIRMWSKKNITKMERTVDAFNVWGAGINPEASLDTNNASDQLITIGNLEHADLHAIAKNTIASSATYEVFWDLLLYALTDRNRPMRNRYFELAAAIEAYDSKKHGLGPIADPVFKVRRKEALETIDDRSAKKFLKRWTPSRSGYSLGERIRRTALEASVPLSQDPDVMATVRNDIAHGNAHPPHGLLHDCHEQALAIARGLALLEAGIV